MKVKEGKPTWCQNCFGEHSCESDRWSCDIRINCEYVDSA